MRWPLLARILLFLASVGVFLAGGHVASEYLIDSQRERQLRELGGIALRRSELAVEYGITTLRELAAEGNLGCDGGALQAVRLHVYQRGAVKDIRLVRPDASVLCSAFSETLEFDKGWVRRADMLPTATGDAFLFRVQQFFGTALGTMIDIDGELSLIGILGFSGAQLDVMPAELRERSEIALELGNWQSIARTATSLPDGSDPYRLIVTSRQYPLQVVIRVERAALAAWNREPYLPIMGLAGLLGTAFGLLLARVLFRPRSPLEELDLAIQRGEIQPYFQPIFDLKSGAISGAEVLARWVKPDGTVISPAHFIELAEQSGRIQALTWQLLRTALAEMRPLLKSDKCFKLSVNISPRHFVTAGFVTQLRMIVAEAGVATRQVALELTEREGFDDKAHAAAVVAQVREFGFKVAIDDVGIGHSGLSQIQSLRADILKVDKFFVDSVGRDASAAAMIGMLVRLAEEMQMSIVAEGIEAREQVDALVACGVGSGQGYVVSPPLAARPFLEFLRAREENAPPRAASPMQAA